MSQSTHSHTDTHTLPLSCVMGCLHVCSVIQMYGVCTSADITSLLCLWKYGRERRWLQHASRHTHTMAHKDARVNMSHSTFKQLTHSAGERDCFWDGKNQSRSDWKHCCCFSYAVSKTIKHWLAKALLLSACVCVWACLCVFPLKGLTPKHTQRLKESSAFSSYARVCLKDNPLLWWCIWMGF